MHAGEAVEDSVLHFATEEDNERERQTEEDDRGRLQVAALIFTISSWVAWRWTSTPSSSGH